jgi:hypothetical protein
MWTQQFFPTNSLNDFQKVVEKSYRQKSIRILSVLNFAQNFFFTTFLNTLALLQFLKANDKKLYIENVAKC